MHGTARITIRRLQQGRRWLKHNVNTRAGTVAALGGLCRGVFLCLCWLLLLLQLTPSFQPLRRAGLEGEAFALGLMVMATFAFTLASLFHPRTEYTPPRVVIAGIVTVGAVYMVVTVVVVNLIEGVTP